MISEELKNKLLDGATLTNEKIRYIPEKIINGYLLCICIEGESDEDRWFHKEFKVYSTEPFIIPQVETKVSDLLKDFN